MSFLEIQVSPRKLKLVHDAVNAALKRDGKPYRDKAVIVEDDGGDAPYIRIVTRAEVAFRCRGHAEFQDALRRHTREIPEMICWAGAKGVDVWWVTPPEGTW